MSCGSLKCFSNFAHALLSSLWDFGISFFNNSTFFPVLTPATTSSPCALVRYSPSISRLPLCPFLVKTTPVALSSPMFPNTIVTTFTAVPFAMSFVIPFFSL